MKALWSGMIACIFAMLPSGAFAKDVALIIANLDGSGFRNESTINNELDGLIRAYRDDGYQVMVEKDVSSGRMLDAVDRFENEMPDADRLVIHFVGQVIESRQSLFLRPRNPRATSASRLHVSELDVELVYDLLSYRPGRNAFVLSTSTDGAVNRLRRKGHIPQGVLVLVGDAFTMKNAVQDGLLQGETGVELNQRAGITALGFVSDFSLAPRGRQAVTQDTAADSALVEMRVWREAAQNGSKAALEGYIDRYPNGLFRGEALARLDALIPRKTLEQTVEESLALNRDDRRNIQKNLTLLGFGTRGVDGLFGRGTRTAIERWQQSEGFKVTGFLDRGQIRLLNETARKKVEADRSSREQADLAYWQQTGSGTNERGLRDYMAKFPEGLFAPQAKQALDRLNRDRQAQNNDAYVKREQALKMTAKTRALVEQRLAGLGYDVGPKDGVFTQETRVAIKSFQKQAGIEATGFMDNQTVTRLVATIFR